MVLVIVTLASLEDGNTRFPVTGTVEKVEGFDVARVRRHHDEHYVGASTVIAVAGPIDVQAVARSLETHFGDLPRGVAPATSTPANSFTRWGAGSINVASSPRRRNTFARRSNACRNLSLRAAIWA